MSSARCDLRAADAAERKALAESRYPLPRVDNDERFTLGMLAAVGEVLHSHGFPAVTSGRDLISLQAALMGFLYEATSPAPSTPPTVNRTPCASREHTHDLDNPGYCMHCGREMLGRNAEEWKP